MRLVLRTHGRYEFPHIVDFLHDLVRVLGFPRQIGAVVLVHEKIHVPLKNLVFVRDEDERVPHFRDRRRVQLAERLERPLGALDLLALGVDGQDIVEEIEEMFVERFADLALVDLKQRRGIFSLGLHLINDWIFL